MTFDLVLSCDACSLASGDWAPTKRKLSRLAKESGWTARFVRQNGRKRLAHFCPDCSRDGRPALWEDMP